MMSNKPIYNNTSTWLYSWPAIDFALTVWLMTLALGNYFIRGEMVVLHLLDLIVICTAVGCATVVLAVVP